MSLFARAQRYAHGDRLTVAGAYVRLRVDGRARRVSLRLDAANREVIATAPTARRLAEAVDFAHQRTAWIETVLGKLPQAMALEPGALIELLGRPCLLDAAGGRARLEPGETLRLVAPAGARFGASALRVLKAESRRVLTERTAHYAARLGQPMPVVTVADPRSRWGSCRQPPRRGPAAAVQVGRIRYSWRLLLCPQPVLDYVVAHECAHLIEANHGPNFWALVRELVGDERPHRNWLRTHANRLHAVG